MTPISRFFRIVATLLLVTTLTGCTKSMRRRHLVAAADRDFKEQHFDSAEARYREALRIPPASPAAIRQLGVLFFEEGRRGEAYPFLFHVVQSTPTDEIVLRDISEIYLESHRFKEAREMATKALQINPKDDRALQVLAETAIPFRDTAQVRQNVQNKIGRAHV